MEKVLIIDDEKPTLDMFGLLLGAYGYQALTAQNAEQGLALYASEKPSIVFTDVKMPGMDGLEVLRRIRDAGGNAEVIVITGHGDTDLAIEALNLDAADFIHKPVGRQALETALKRAEDRIRRRRRKEEQISLRYEGDTAVIDIKGNVTAMSEAALAEAHEKAAGAPRLLLNFDYYSAVNGAGVAVLIRILSESRKSGQAAGIAGLSENFQKICRITGVAKLATMFDTETEALNSL